MIFEPATYEEVQECFRIGEPLRIRSAALTTTGTHTLSLAKLDQILLYEPEEMIVKVQAGMTLSILNDILRKNGQWIPTLVAEEHPDPTVGAAIANDRYHPRALACGALRTTILGGTFIAADGMLFRSGSRVVKSVAGYDTHRAFCGSRGLFGVIVEITLKVQPLPEAFYWCDISRREEIQTYYPTICEADGPVFCELAGFSEDIDHDRNALSEMRSLLKSYHEPEARQKIRSLIEKHVPSDVNPLRQLRSVFDPKGLLQ